MQLIREKLLSGKSEKNRYRKIAEYLMSVFAVNYVVFLIMILTKSNLENLIANLNGYVLFAWKYMTIACIFAVAEPWVEKYVRENIKVSLLLPQKQCSFRYGILCLSLCAAVLFMLNAIRMSDHNFWGDEAFSIARVKFGFADIIEDATKDYHPPLYHLLLKTTCMILGESPVVYRLASILPYALILLTALTVVRRRFGKATGLILMTLASLLPNAVYFNIEVRGYAWAELFVLLSYLALYGIVKENRRKDYVLFVLFSLAAAYTHYYALLSVAFFYMVFIVYVLLCRREDIVKAAIACGTTVFGYLPWVIYLLRAVRNASESFWIEEMLSFQNCMEYIFNTRYGNILLTAMLLSVSLFVLYETRILTISICNRKKISLAVNIRECKINDTCVWIAAGMLCVIGTFTMGIVLSYLVRPVFIFRYMYPSTVIAWLLTAVCIPKMNAGRVYTVLLLAVTLASAVPEYKITYRIEKNSDKTLAATLEATQNRIGKEDVILTNIPHMDWTIADYYYPGTEHMFFTMDDFPKLKDDIQYWMIVDREMADRLSGNGTEETAGVEKIVDCGVIGTAEVWVYRVDEMHKTERFIRKR